MGNITSRFFHNLLEDATAYAEPTAPPRPATPLPTVRHRVLDFDPRSPSDEVWRTPIEIVSSSHRPNNHLSKMMARLELDPRSPTLEIIRTPIQVLNETVASSDSPAIPIIGSFLETDIDETGDSDSDYDEDTRLKTEKIVAEPKTDSPPVNTTESFIFVDNEVEIQPSAEQASFDSVTCLTPTMEHAERTKFDKENGSVQKKKPFPTPESKTTPCPKVRTPLGIVSSNNSPLLIVRAKQRQAVNKTRIATPQSGLARARITEL